MSLSLVGKVSDSDGDGLFDVSDRIESVSGEVEQKLTSIDSGDGAIATGTLSRRWRSLWTNTNSIDIHLGYADKLRRNLGTTLNNTMRKITSPFIHSFSFEFVDTYFNLKFWAPYLDIMIRDVCSRNVHQLKSLVSIELVCKPGTFFHKDWQFPEDCDTINLPNLKNLTVHFGRNYQWIEKLIKACPSLEQLSLNCSARNIHGSLQRRTFVINSPNLEYLDISAPKYMTFSFEDDPIVLREAKIEFTDLPQVRLDKDKLSRLYKAVSNVKILTIDSSAVDALSRVLI
ncbi:putative F-box/LRR-repeat protein At5g02700 [Silene latifolia]|uniref:putative F-box/LRR-repeat protein At5g02700 n=1 Tax=Silene latifolia TaxID=37657 RepID=UPI003D7894E0